MIPVLRQTPFQIKLDCPWQKKNQFFDVLWLVVARSGNFDLERPKVAMSLLKTSCLSQPL